MFKNVFISISAAALLFSGLASNVNVSAQTPFVADDNFNVVVSQSCDLAMRYEKSTDNEMTWTMGPEDSQSYGQEPGNGIPGLSLYNYAENQEGYFSLICMFPEYELTFEEYSNWFMYDGYTKKAVSVDSLVNFTQDSRNNIKTIYALENKSGQVENYVFEGNNGYYYLMFMDNYSNIPGFSFDRVQIQFDSLSPSDPNIYPCFKDVDYDFVFQPFICNLKENSIIGGYDDGTYRPSRNVTRGEMAVFIKKAFGIETNTSCGDFSDMNASTPFYAEATSLKCAGIIGGSDDGKGGKQYLWKNNVTRGEMAVFIMKAANKTGENIATNTSCENFNDMNASTPFYAEATSLKCADIIGGYPSSNGGRDYRFPNNVNRGELSVFVVRGMETAI